MQPAPLEATPAALNAPKLFRKLLVICLSYSLAAVGAAGLLILFGFGSSSQHAPLSYIILICGTVGPVLCVVDVLVLRIHFGPIGHALQISPAHSAYSEAVAAAHLRARHFPVLTVFRVMCIHGPTALVLVTFLNLEVGNRFFGTSYGAFDVAMLWSTLFVIVPAHALLEFFAVQEVMHKLIPSMPPARTELELPRGAWTVGIRRRLLIASVFIATVPLAVLGFTVALKLDDALSHPGEASERLRLGTVVAWMALLTAFSTAITVSIAFLLARYIGQMTEGLLKRMDQVEAGNFEARLDVTSTDEFAHLYQGFNRMIARLQERQRLHDALGMYVSPLLAEQVRNSGLKLGGASVQATVLFSDIRGFTTLSEKLRAEEIVELLNRYFAAVGPAIDGYGGWINKFGGDSILVVFGVPVAQTDSAQRAVSAALAMRAALAIFNAEQEKQGGPALRIGIGIHTGWLVAGNMGTPARMEYTVIGDAVNIASRLQTLTKALGVDILISADVYQATSKAITAQEMAPAEVQGKSVPLRIYALT